MSRVRECGGMKEVGSSSVKYSGRNNGSMIVLIK